MRWYFWLEGVWTKWAKSRKWVKSRGVRRLFKVCGGFGVVKRKGFALIKDLKSLISNYEYSLRWYLRESGGLSNFWQSGRKYKSIVLMLFCGVMWWGVGGGFWLLMSFLFLSRWPFLRLKFIIFMIEVLLKIKIEA